MGLGMQGAPRRICRYEDCACWRSGTIPIVEKKEFKEDHVNEFSVGFSV